MTELKWTITYVICVIALTAFFNLCVTYNVDVGFDKGFWMTLLIYGVQLCGLIVLFVLARCSLRRAYPSTKIGESREQ